VRLTQECRRSMRLRTKAAARDERGSVSLQLAVVFPVVLLLLLLSVQAGLLFHARHLARAAAEEGLRSARLYQHRASDGSASANSLLNASAGDLITDRAVSTTRTTESATVRVHGYALSVLPGLRLPVDETASGPVEHFTSEQP
jgi:Flp pilus assembly protein TadG